MKKNTANNGYKLTFNEYIKDKFGWEIVIVQKQNWQMDLFHKKIVGKWEGALGG